MEFVYKWEEIQNIKILGLKSKKYSFLIFTNQVINGLLVRPGRLTERHISSCNLISLPCTWLISLCIMYKMHGIVAMFGMTDYGNPPIRTLDHYTFVRLKINWNLKNI